MTTSEKVAYLKGLADGLNLGKETKEEKLISAIIDTLECIALDIEDLEDTVFEMGEELDAISDDLSVVEDFLLDEDDDNDCCCCDDDDYDDDDHHCCSGHGGHHGGGCCGGHQHQVLYEITCPACENAITIDEEVLSLGSIKCPSCDGTLEFDLDDETASSAE